MKPRWVRRPTGRGVAAATFGAGLLAAGALWRYPGVVLLGGALLALAALAFLSVLGRPPVTVRRTVWPVEVTRFEPCEARLHLRRRFGGVLALAIETTEHVAGHSIPVRTPTLNPRATAEVTYQIPTQRRGVFAVGPLEVRRRALAGLAENRAELGGTVLVRVLPRVFPVAGMPKGVRRGSVEAGERVPHGGTDLVGIREYAPGDDLRRLHWATSARAGRLMVREDADPSTAHLTVLLDDRSTSYPDQDMEDEVEVAASLAVAAAEVGHGVRLLTITGRLDRSLPASSSGLAPSVDRDLIAALADVSLVDEAFAARIAVSELDIVAVLTGAGADLAPLIAEAARAAFGVVAVLDRTTPGRVDAGASFAGTSTVIRGHDCASLLARWGEAVVGR